MSNFCCRTFALRTEPDLAALYGALCSVIPPRYACGQGFASDRMRFGLENGVRAELRFAAGRCEVWLLACPPGQAGAYARVYGPLFEELVRRLDSAKEGGPHAGR